MIRQFVLPAVVGLAVLASSVTSLQAQKSVPAVPSQPAKRTGTPRSLPAAPVPGAASQAVAPPRAQAPPIGPDEAKRLKAIYDALEPDEQNQMRAFYDATDVDLLALFASVASVDDVEQLQQPLLPMIMRKKFARTPKAVLAARTSLGLEEQDRPDDAASNSEWATWLHLHVMAGEWDTLQWFLDERVGDQGEAIYSHIIQSTNQGDPMLLPEEVLALADAAPGEPTNWQVDVLGKLLKQASKKSSIGPLLAQLRSGTRLFGGEDEANHPRTAALLARAGLPDEAHSYLPSLENAFEEGDGRAILIHGLYHADRDETQQAWSLFGKVALLPEEEFELRQEGLREAVKRLPEVPETKATAWLTEVFEDEKLAPAALELIALDAMALRQSRKSVTERARAILVMKSAVETLLASGRVKSSTIKVPLRMLTMGLVAEAEAATTARAARGGAPPGVALLMRALPDESWLDAIEPSLAARAYRAFIGVATRADEPDVALDILEAAIAKYPDEAETMGGEFLDLWVKRLRPDSGSNQNAAMRSAFLVFGGRSSVSAAPLTRGRQARNLDRLIRTLELLEARGVDPRTIPGVVRAFQACHSQSEAYTAVDIERVLGPIDEMPADTAAQLAGAMQAGLSGGWRSREVQQRFGMRRNGAEIARVVEDGYALALRLIDRARTQDADSWQHAVRKAALAYERLEHRRAQSDEELADYDQLRDESFAAFEDAARTYADAAARGEEKASVMVFQAWFNAAIGASNLSDVTRDNVLYEGSARDEQIDHIRATIAAMDPAMAEEHTGLLAGALVSAIDSLNPEVKPRVVRHALRIVGDHPSSAPLRRIDALYADLIEDEIHLRLQVDGADRVGTANPFGAVLTLRYTNAVDRETDGFAKYLQNSVWVYFGNRGTTMNYRDRLETAIRDAMGDAVEVEGIGFFDSMHPSREVVEGGERGWQEKPLAYLVLKATDPSIERLPPVRMDLDFMDQTGPVILAIESNAPPIDAAGDAPDRPVHDLTIDQVVDTRNASEELLLEIRATGRGVLPSLEGILAGVETPIEGYTIAEGGIDVHPMNMMESADSDDNMFWSRNADVDDDKFTGVDDDGVFRQNTERSWSIRYVPDSTAPSTGGAFVLPTVVASSDGVLNTRFYDDMDLVEVEGASVPIHGGLRPRAWAFLIGGLLLGGLGIFALLRMQKSSGRDEVDVLAGLLLARPTPLGAVSALVRIDQEYGERLGTDRRTALHLEIQSIEKRFFGPGAETPNGEFESVVSKWANEAIATNPLG